MIRPLLIGALAAATLAATLPRRSQSAAGVSVIRLDPRFDRLIARDAVIEKISDGFQWVEGPVWSPKGYLLFSDIPNNAVFEWRRSIGPKLYLRPSGYSGEQVFEGREPGSNGLAFDRSGRLVLCQHGDRRIARLESDGRLRTLADRYQGRRLNSPNDLVFHANGDLYFTDPPFGLPQVFEDIKKELQFSGVYRLTPQGELTLLTKELNAPNGIAFSPDGSTLYVSNADKERPLWMAFPVLDDGRLADGRVFRDGRALLSNGPGVPDGMKTDRQGNLYAAGPGGLYVFSAGGAHLGTIHLGVATSNCALGENGAASTAIYRVPLRTI